MQRPPKSHDLSYWEQIYERLRRISELGATGGTGANPIGLIELARREALTPSPESQPPSSGALQMPVAASVRDVDPERLRWVLEQIERTAALRVPRPEDPEEHIEDIGRRGPPSGPRGPSAPSGPEGEERKKRRGRSPTLRCTNPNCGAPHGGSKGSLCPDCTKKRELGDDTIPPPTWVPED
jgi:hypothetical protein